MKKGRLAKFWLEDQIPGPLPTFKWWDSLGSFGFSRDAPAPPAADPVNRFHLVPNQKEGFLRRFLGRLGEGAHANGHRNPEQ
jgi:hypothetical protein